MAKYMERENKQPKKKHLKEILLKVKRKEKERKFIIIRRVMKEIFLMVCTMEKEN